MILKHNFSAKEMAELKKERINQKIKIKEAREWTAYLKDEDDRYVDILAAIQPAIDKLKLSEQSEKEMTKAKATKWQDAQDYIINLCICISISLLALAAYYAWFY